MKKKDKILHVSIFACIEVLMNLLDKVNANSTMSDEYKEQAEKLNKLNENIIDQTFEKQNSISKSTFSSTCANRVETAVRRTINELKI